MYKKVNIEKPFKINQLKVAIFGFIVNVATCAVFAGEMPQGQPDFMPLSLKVTNIRVVEKITQEVVMGRGTTLSAKDGYKLIVVTLEGISPNECYYAYTIDSFVIFYAHEEIQKYGSSKGEMETVEEFVHAAAVKAGNFDWSIRPKGGTCQIKQMVQQGHFTLEIAAIVPVDVESCQVIIPALAQGQAIIPAATKVQSGQSSELSAQAVE